MIRDFLFSNKKNILKQSYLWNMIASGVNASEAIIILIVATRTIGIAEAGIYTISFSVANLMMTIGKFSMRNFHATDVSYEYEWKDYLYSRMFSSLLMVISSLIYLWFQIVFRDYSIHKAVVMLFVILLYAVEVVEDVFLSEFQRRERLDIGSKIFSLRWIGTLTVWGICLVILKDSLSAVIISLIADLLIFVGLWSIVLREFQFKKEKVNVVRTMQLIKHNLPLFVSGFCAYYITNASKFSVDRFLGDEIQACYSFIVMPIFVIGLVNTIIYQPVLVKMAQDWQDANYTRFQKRIFRQIGIILLISLICLVGAWFLGIPVLSLLYATDLSEYKFDLLIILVGGAWLAMAGFFNAIIVVMRKQKIMMFVYCIIALLAFVLSDKITAMYAVRGASVSNMIWLAMEALIFAGYLVVERIHIILLKKERD